MTVSAISLLVMAILFCTEFASFLRVETASSMFVDLPSEAEMRNREPLRISLHLSLPEYPCAGMNAHLMILLMRCLNWTPKCMSMCCIIGSNFDMHYYFVLCDDTFKICPNQH
jgi:hypothetical protein